MRGTTFALIGPVATSQGNIVSLVCLDDCTPATTFSGCPVAAYTGFGVTVEGGRVTSGCETFGVSRGSDIWNAAFEAITTFEQSFAQGNNVNNPGNANLGRERGTVRSEERAREQNQEQGDNNQPSSGTVGPVQGTGVNGLVTNARNGRAISGATVQVDGTTAASTGSDGRFTLATSTTSRVVRVSAPGFVTSTRTVPGTTTELVISLVPISSTDDIIIVLNWGAQPRDLDAHISGPDRAAGRFHVFFANPRAPLPSPYAILDVDDVSSFGPETITISRDPTTGLFRAGEYRYWVHNFSGSPGFDVSGAQVTIVKGSNQVAEFNVSDSSGNPSLPIWRVANLTVDTAGNVTVTPVRTFTSGSSSSIFTIPSGSGEGVDSFGIDDGSPAAPTEK